MILRVIFDRLIPIPSEPNHVQERAFSAEDGWVIERRGEGTFLIKRAGNEPSWRAVPAFEVGGYGYSVQHAPVAEAEPAKKGKR